ncbi:MAG: glutamine synthetase, partial [Varibaculum cambriense]|nr:glutamine synthetase [Varibaculum cambriense]
SDKERRAQGIPALPLTLEEALSELRQSEFMAKVLGEEVFSYVLRNKEREWREYSAQITRGELAKFLRV